MGIYTLRSMRRARARTVVCGIGIALSCALITAILTTALSLDKAVYQSVERTQGSWEFRFSDLSAKEVERVRQDPRTASAVLVREYGAAELPRVGDWERGTRMSLISMPGEREAAGIVVPPEVERGRLPESSREIVLPAELEGERLSGDARSEISSEGKLALGSSLRVPLGRRVIDDAAGEGPRALGFSERFYDGEEGGSVERLENVRDLDFTVVGFYRTDANWTFGEVSVLALTGDDEAQEPIGTMVFSTSSGLSSQQDADAYAAMLAKGGAGVAEAHEDLLRLRGFTGDNALTASIIAIAAVLGVVVAAASVSLIRTGFGISVSERSRELGLLSSLGASPHQIRRIVRIEAAALAAAGVPAGILIGLGGTWGIFRLVGRDLASLLTGSADGLPIILSPAVIGAATLLSLAVIAASAFAPARRAGRIPAVEALRSVRDVRFSRFERWRGRAGVGEGRRPLTGVAGLLAHRNRTRSARGQRAVTISLAVSVALILTCGSLVTYAGLLSAATAGASDGDLVASLNQAHRSDRSLESMLTYAERVNRALGEVDGVTPIGYSVTTDLLCRTPPGMLDHIDREASDEIYTGPDGAAYPLVNVFFIDDASWKTYVRDLGLSEADYCDATRPRAIGFNLILAAEDGETFTQMKPFKRTGGVRLYTRFDRNGSWGFTSLMGTGDGGQACAVYATGSTSARRLVPLEKAARCTFDMEVGALADTPPASLSSLRRMTTPTLLLPLSCLRPMATAAYPDGGDVAGATYLDDPILFDSGGVRDLHVQLSFLARDSVEAASEMQRIINERFSGEAGRSISIDDNASTAQREHAGATAIQTFTMIFCVAVVLVAVANVFNTASASIIMRRHEFAVLRSVGMGNRTFWHMITLGCVSHAARGLAIGLVIACAANYALYRALSLSVSGVEPQLPAGWLAAAAATVAVTLAVSVAYGLRRCRVDSVVEAARDDER